VNGRSFAAGDRVLFRGGGVWRATLRPSGSGRSGVPVVYGAYGTGRAIFDGSGTSAFAAIGIYGRTDLRFERLELRNWTSERYGIYLEGGSRLTFDSVRITNTYHGIHPSPSRSTSAITFQNGQIVNLPTGTSSTAGVIPSSSSDWVFRNSEFAWTGESCMIDAGARSRYESVRVHDCGRYSGISWGTHGLYLKGPDQQVYNSDVWNAPKHCISTRGSGATIEGNRLRACDTGIGFFNDLSSDYGPSRYARNAIWDYRTGIYINTASYRAFDIVSNAIVANGGDYRPAAIFATRVGRLRVERNVVMGNPWVVLRIDGGDLTSYSNLFYSTAGNSTPFGRFGSWLSFAGFRSAEGDWTSRWSWTALNSDYSSPVGSAAYQIGAGIIR
jgi:hypothetical protein